MLPAGSLPGAAASSAAPAWLPVGAQGLEGRIQTASAGASQSCNPGLCTAVAKQVDGPTLLAALNNGLSGWTGNDSAAGRFPQASK